MPVPQSAADRTALQARLHKLNGSAGLLVAKLVREAPDSAALAMWQVQLRSHHLDALERFHQISGALRPAWRPARFDPEEEAMERLNFSAALALVPDRSRFDPRNGDRLASPHCHRPVADSATAAARPY